MSIAASPGATAAEEQELGGRPRKWTREEYYRAADLGVFRPDERLELIRGVIIQKWTDGEPRKWTREEYHRAAELGVFRPDERLELIRGEIIQKVSPQQRAHGIAILRGAKVLEAAFGAGYYVSSQLPLGVAGDGEPEPDLMVVVGAPEEYTDHPTPQDVRLLVEVADTTLGFDRGGKAAVYAEAGVADYWILNLPGRALEVRRDPVPLPDPRGGFGYRSVTVYREDEAVSPLAAPEAVIRVADMLPPALAKKGKQRRVRGKE